MGPRPGLTAAETLAPGWLEEKEHVDACPMVETYSFAGCS